jgi:hypothetical protein
MLGLLASVTAFAGSAVIGSVAGSVNATVGGQALLPNEVLFSGDSIQVKDGVAVVAIGKSNRMVFGHDTIVSLIKTEKGVTVLLSQGSVSMYHGNEGDALQVKVGEASVSPAIGFKTLGQVAMLNGAAVVMAKEGSLVVENNGQKITVDKGRTIAVSAKTEPAPQVITSTGPHVPVGTGPKVGALAANYSTVVSSAIDSLDSDRGCPPSPHNPNQERHCHPH